jgi:hypothetical protein
LKVDRRVSSNVGFSAGYNYRSGEFGYGELTQEHGVTIGLDYSIALSRTRRLDFHLEAGPSRLGLGSVLVPATSEPIGDDSAVDPGGIEQPTVDEALVRLSTEASVTYPFRRNWKTAARYRRSVEYLAVLGQPALSDAARLELSGLLTRRIDLQASLGYALAASALSANQGMEAYTGQVALRYALNRALALSAEYTHYYYDLRKQASLAPHLPRTFEQNSVRLGVVLFIEALR